MFASAWALILCDVAHNVSCVYLDNGTVAAAAFIGSSCSKPFKHTCISEEKYVCLMYFIPGLTLKIFVVIFICVKKHIFSVFYLWFEYSEQLLYNVHAVHTFPS